MKILLAVDGSRHSAAAVRHVISLAHHGMRLDIILVTVVPPADTWELKRFMKLEEIEAMQEARGGDLLTPARALLDAENIPYTPKVLLGPVAETIAAEAREMRCELIVIGSHGHTAAASAILGSTALAVIHLTEIPVTMVR